MITVTLSIIYVVLEAVTRRSAKALNELSEGSED